MIGLKGYIPGLARLLSTTPAALYERQRALVRAGLLADVVGGRGPGSGVRTTPSSVALILLSVLATDRLNETEARARAVADARPKAVDRCPFTGTQSFQEALAYILGGTGYASAVLWISVSRTADRAVIRYYDRRRNHEIRESVFEGLRSVEPGIAVTAVLSQNLLQQIAADVQAMVLETFNDQEPR